MQLNKGDFVENYMAPEWGTGEVLDSSGEYVHVAFERAEGRKAFDHKDNPLQKVSKPEGFSILQKNQSKEENGIKSLEERVKRDEINARHAKELAETELKGLFLVNEPPNITSGHSASHMNYLLNKSNEYESIQAVCMTPFHAMIEVETVTKDTNDELIMKQLWYANENSRYDLPLFRDSRRVNVLSWTHPGVQLALVGELGGPQTIRAHEYTLLEVTPLARAKFSQVLPSISGLYEPGGSVGQEKHKVPTTGLKAVKLDMTKDQVMAFISKMNGMMLVSGAPGSGKTTVGMQRIRFLYDQQEIRKEDLKNVTYSPELTRIFLANQNLIDYSKEVLA